MDKQYRRALTLLKGSDSDLIEQDVRFRYLAAKCLVECQEWEECLMMVGGWEEDSLDSIDMQVLVQLLVLQSTVLHPVNLNRVCTAGLTSMVLELHCLHDQLTSPQLHVGSS